MDMEARKRAIREKRAAQRAAAAKAEAAAKSKGGAKSKVGAKDEEAALKEWLAAMVPLPNVLLLDPAPAGTASDYSEVLASFAAPMDGACKELAGRSYQAKCVRVAKGVAEGADDAEDDEDAEGDAKWGKKNKKKKKAGKQSAGDAEAQSDALGAESGESLYEKLGLGALRFRATEEDIRKAYRLASLKCAAALRRSRARVSAARALKLCAAAATRQGRAL